jgi:hypothetical protein
MSEIFVAAFIFRPSFLCKKVATHFLCLVLAKIEDEAALAHEGLDPQYFLCNLQVSLPL